MKFCPECNTLLTQSTASGTIKYICNSCKNEQNGTKFDTLITERILETTETDLKYTDLFINTQFDSASCRVAVQCPNPKCNLPYMSLVRPSIDNILYICKCGERYTQNEYERILEEKKK